MKLKYKNSDFCVDEIYDLKSIRNKKDEKNKSNFYYLFLLLKKDYTTQRAIEKVSKVFRKNIKDIHYCGMKDKVAITKQLISIKNCKRDLIEKNIEYFNLKNEDLKLKYISQINSRLNLGDNIGNKFKMTIRDLDDKLIKKFEKNFKNFEKKGFLLLNFFESQRFGRKENNHIIGKLILKNEMKKAVDLILEDFEDLKILKHLEKSPKDFVGAFKSLSKKIQTIYIHSYQSYIFNEVLKKINFRAQNEICLLNFNSKNNERIENIINEILKKDRILREDFLLKHIPTLKNEKNSFRKIFSIPKEMSYKIFYDEIFKNNKKIVLRFSLEKGEYATNIVTQLFF